MSPTAWLVKWRLMGSPWQVPLEMLLTAPERAFPYFRWKDMRGIFGACGIRADIAVGQGCHRVAILFWQPETSTYKARLLDERLAHTRDGIQNSPHYSNLDEAREWLQQQI